MNTMGGETNLDRQLPVQHIELEPVGEVIGNPLSLALLEASKPFEGMTKCENGSNRKIRSLLSWFIIHKLLFWNSSKNVEGTCEARHLL